MPVEFAAITTLKEVYDYAVGSGKDAKKCPSVSADYDNLASQIKDYVNLQVGGNWNEFAGVKEFKQTILDINADCIKEAGSAPKITVTPKITTGSLPGSNMQITAVKAGFPWWIVLLLGGGALAYYFYSKKSGGSAAGAPVQKKNPGRRKRRHGR